MERLSQNARLAISSMARITSPEELAREIRAAISVADPYEDLTGAAQALFNGRREAVEGHGGAITPMGAGMEAETMQRIFQIIVHTQQIVDIAVLAADPRIPEQSRVPLSISMWQFARLSAASQGQRNPEALHVTPPTVPARGPVGDENLDRLAINKMQRSIDSVPVAKDEYELGRAVRQR